MQITAAELQTRSNKKQIKYNRILVHGTRNMLEKISQNLKGKRKILNDERKG